MESWGDELYSETRRQRCWMHNTVSLLNALPKSLLAKVQLHEIWMAPSLLLELSSRATRLSTRRRPISSWATETRCSSSTTSRLSTGYICNTTNPIESTFAIVRHRSARAKNCA